MKFYYINNDQCTDCNRCSERCKSKAIFISDGERNIDYEKCTACGICMKSCTIGAITLESVGRLTREIDKIEHYKMRIQRLENELSSLKSHLASNEESIRELVTNLPVATLLADKHNKITVANSAMIDALRVDPLLLSDMSSDLSGESIESVISDDIVRLIASSTAGVAGQSHVIEMNGHPVSLSLSTISGEYTLLAVRDLSDPVIAADEIKRRLNETIDRKMAMVQQIGFLLGEDVSVVVNNLNSIIKIVESSSCSNDK